MKKHINIKDRQISYELRKSKRASRLRITIYNDGRIAVTLPSRAGISEAEKFILKKSKWLFKKVDYFKKFKILPAGISSGGKRDYLKNKGFARRLVLEKIKSFNEFYGFKVGKINIKNQKTRWGSCSGKGNLNFNYKLVYLPSEMVDYLVVHELCHLKEFNHSPAFWHLVSKTIPDYKKIRKEMKAVRF